MHYNILSDSGWRYTPNARPERGWHEYYRVINLIDPVTPEQIEMITKAIKEQPYCPAGQGEVMLLKSESLPTKLYFTCFNDSSD